jgi:hypothetical protein
VIVDHVRRCSPRHVISSLVRASARRLEGTSVMLEGTPSQPPSLPCLTAAVFSSSAPSFTWSLRKARSHFESNGHRLYPTATAYQSRSCVQPSQHGRLTKAPGPFASTVYIAVFLLHAFPFSLQPPLTACGLLHTDIAITTRTCSVSYLGQRQLRPASPY